MIKNAHIKKLIEEASKFKGTRWASENLGSFLDKIREIEEESRFVPQSYDSFVKTYKRDFDFNLQAANLGK